DITHYEQALELWQSLPGLGLSGADEKENIQSFLRKNPTTCFVVKKNDTLIGTILGGSDGRRGYIYHLAVKTSEQNKGIGKKLVDMCLAEFKKNGIQKCHIFVISDNEKGIAFWKNMGWQLRGDILIMSKDINS
ncbi:MAG: GNAT family N-acetyltransferase, partial [Pelolinea sp.]|nr:GNAT family N-acetyltransferase [Pelolinea sp.]